VVAHPADADAIARMCGLWPLAIRSAGDRLIAAPHWSLRKLARRLGDENERLSELRTESTDIREEIAASYNNLNEADRRAVLTLAATKRRFFTLRAAASILGGDRRAVDRLLDRLVALQFLDCAIEQIPSDGEVAYQIPELFRLFAMELITNAGAFIGLG
jgi:hypothetical protein